MGRPFVVGPITRALTIGGHPAAATALPDTAAALFAPVRVFLGEKPRSGSSLVGSANSPDRVWRG